MEAQKHGRDERRTCLVPDIWPRDVRLGNGSPEPVPLSLYSAAFKLQKTAGASVTADGQGSMPATLRVSEHCRVGCLKINYELITAPKDNLRASGGT